MTTIVTRTGKGSELTTSEVDANFTNLNTDKIEADSSDTLTNKSVDLANNTLIGTTAQFNGALSDANFRTDEDHVTVAEFLEDFTDHTLNTFRWYVNSGSDAQAADPVIGTGEPTGVLNLVTGDDAAASMAVNGSHLTGHRIWRVPATSGDLLEFECRLDTDTITNVCIFCGFTDIEDSLEMPFTLGASDTLTSNATDAVGFLFDTAADTDNIWLVGVANDVDATHQDSSTAYVASTMIRLGFTVDSSQNANFYINGSQVGSQMSSAVNTGIRLTPVVAVFSRTASSRTVQVDYIQVKQNRYT